MRHRVPRMGPKCGMPCLERGQNAASELGNRRRSGQVPRERKSHNLQLGWALANSEAQSGGQTNAFLGRNTAHELPIRSRDALDLPPPDAPEAPDLGLFCLHVVLCT